MEHRNAETFQHNGPKSGTPKHEQIKSNQKNNQNCFNNMGFNMDHRNAETFQCNGLK